MEQGLTPDERSANAILEKLKLELVNPSFNVVIRDFFESKNLIENSKLYAVLDMMPKGAVHHIHSIAAPTVENYLELTRQPEVYYNQTKKLFKVFPKTHQIETDYL
jgi:hypothetical protein